mgnify:FL=1
MLTMESAFCPCGVCGTQTLVDVSDCTSALLLESLKASSEFLFSNPAEVCRPQKVCATCLHGGSTCGGACVVVSAAWCLAIVFIAILVSSLVLSGSCQFSLLLCVHSPPCGWACSDPHVHSQGLVTTLSNLRSLVEGSSLVKKSRGVASKPKRRSSAPASAPDVPQAPSLAEENPRVWSVCSNLGPVSGLLRDILAQSRSA